MERVHAPLLMQPLVQGFVIILFVTGGSLQPSTGLLHLASLCSLCHPTFTASHEI